MPFVDLNSIQLDTKPDYTNPAVRDAAIQDLYGEQPSGNFVDLSNLKLDQKSVPEAGFFDHIAEDLQKRQAMGQESTNAYAQGKQDFPRTALQLLGNVGFGAMNDVAGEALKPVASALASLATPEFKQLLGQGANYISQSSVGVAANEGLTQLGDLAQKNPSLERDATAIGNAAGVLPIGGLLGMAGTAARPVVGNSIEKLGEVFSDSGAKAAAANRSKFVQELITPNATPSVRGEQFTRSKEKGFLRNRVVEPTPQEIEIMDTVSQLPVSKNKSLLANYNIIEEANQKEAQDLMSALQANNVAINPADVQTALHGTLNSLKNSPFITGDAEKSAERVIAGMQQALKNNPSDAAGLLQARKDFDTWVKSQKGSGVFDPSRDSAVTTAVQQVRQTINNLVENAVPNTGFKASLRKQSNLYRAMDNLETKGAYEPSNAIKRGAQKAADTVLPVKGVVAKTALAAGLSGAALSSLPVTGGALAIYGAQKAIRSPTTRKAAGSTLKTIGKGIKP